MTTRLVFVKPKGPRLGKVSHFEKTSKLLKMIHLFVFINFLMNFLIVGALIAIDRGVGLGALHYIWRRPFSFLKNAPNSSLGPRSAEGVFSGDDKHSCTTNASSYTSRVS